MCTLLHEDYEKDKDAGQEQPKCARTWLRHRERPMMQPKNKETNAGQKKAKPKKPGREKHGVWSLRRSRITRITLYPMSTKVTEPGLQFSIASEMEAILAR